MDPWIAQKCVIWIFSIWGCSRYFRVPDVPGTCVVARESILYNFNPFKWIEAKSFMTYLVTCGGECTILTWTKCYFAHDAWVCFVNIHCSKCDIYKCIFCDFTLSRSTKTFTRILMRIASNFWLKVGQLALSQGVETRTWTWQMLPSFRSSNCLSISLCYIFSTDFYILKFYFLCFLQSNFEKLLILNTMSADTTKLSGNNVNFFFFISFFFFFFFFFFFGLPKAYGVPGLQIRS